MLHVKCATNSKVAAKLMCFESSYKFKCTLSCYIKSHTFWGIWSNSLTFCSLKSQNLENPTDPFSCSDLSKWCASFSDMRRYQLCIVFFTFSPELVNSWMIACSFLLRHVMKPHFFSNNVASLTVTSIRHFRDWCDDWHQTVS